jgi:hypothetical protein
MGIGGVAARASKVIRVLILGGEEEDIYLFIYFSDYIY